VHFVNNETLTRLFASSIGDLRSFLLDAAVSATRIVAEVGPGWMQSTAFDLLRPLPTVASSVNAVHRASIPHALAHRS
jgi:hypothetical protein